MITKDIASFSEFVSNSHQDSSSSTEADEMLLKIRTMNNRLISVSVKPSDLIEVVKFKISDKEGISPSQMNIVFGGRKLEDSKTLSDYNIKEGSFLLVVPKFRAGP